MLLGYFGWERIRPVRCFFQVNVILDAYLNESLVKTDCGFFFGGKRLFWRKPPSQRISDRDKFYIPLILTGSVDVTLSLRWFFGEVFAYILWYVFVFFAMILLCYPVSVSSVSIFCRKKEVL